MAGLTVPQIPDMQFFQADLILMLHQEPSDAFWQQVLMPMVKHAPGDRSLSSMYINCIYSERY